MPAKPWVWQQDNSAVHTARIIKSLFQEENVTNVQWPARSPDLSPIENVWKILQDMVYNSGQFKSKDDLWKEVERCARKIPRDTIKNLYSNYINRLVKIISNGGNVI